MSYDDDYEDNRVKEVGARVQQNNSEPEPIGGVIEAFLPAEMSRPDNFWYLPKEEQDKCYEKALIKWDDGTSTTERKDYVVLEDLPHERKFRIAARTAGKLIDEQLAIASAAIDKAEEIATQYGVPFDSGVSPLGQSYYPSSTRDMYPGLSKDFIDSLTGAYHSEYGDEGWQHSAVCY